MRRRLALLCVLAASLAGVVSTPSLSATGSPVSAVKSCGAGYVHAYLPWGEKCLRAGEFCKVGNPAYLKYGYYCPADGHLRRR